MVATSAHGFVNLAQFSIAYEMAVHQARKFLGVGEATVCGCINTMANAIGFFLVLGLTPALENKEFDITCGIFAGLLALGTIAMIAVRGVK